MREDNLASDFARTFSERFPEKRGQLFHVANERNNAMQAIKAKALGIVPGVSDFLYFELGGRINGNCGTYTYLIGIELKLPGNYHDKNKVIRQLNWAKVLEAQGGIWRLCTTVEQAISCTLFDFKGLSIEEVEEMLKQDKNKTIKF